ncbi:peptide ABC transporter substrate-binding protein [Sphaerobacter thermophilus]|uniref:Extracellular solute-binding protein family 5 n=1 Tax=Sphaerobacter thermophilus (strain ATCC 49802 / DSM 20745 / KCCM 41009 / NCIMB 13125 / S 6022) TaxID=479434 RepID=D1C7Q9_SPHTD|nr:peptide ABC transporter substrate-binding protein [Sphaerobacter thermophilus]ACZ37892.1 extracellular solute-binding protein family 5 [Sphaerobacter thermophilus DSM 20745]
MDHTILNERALRAAILNGQLTRREVLKRAAALGLTAPVIASLLAACGGAEGAAPTGDTGGATTATTDTGTGAASPTSDSSSDSTSGGRGRGQGDLLRMLFWQAPTILNTHLSTGDKDTLPSRLVTEPLLNINPDGSLGPVLAAEVPSLENGGVAPDGMSVTYKLKQGVVWSDGEPFTARDVRFTWEWVSNPDNSSPNQAVYQIIRDVEIVDDYTVTVHFHEPTPGWFNPFVGGFKGGILPEHIMKDYVGERAREAPFNLQPIGTGPYKVVEFRPGDVVLFELNENFREPDKPYFRRIEWKGGGDATSAARAVLQTGEADLAWNIQVEKQVLESLNQGNLGSIVVTPGASAEQIMVNFADPNVEVNGARSEPSTTHPFLSDPLVRQALALACDRQTIADVLYGETGRPTANVLNAPPQFVSPNTSFRYDLEEAGRLLDEAGWVKNGDYREKDGRQLAVVLSTTVNPVRQRQQEILKASWEQLGIRTELKAVESAVFFSSDAGNPDTYSHFYCDLQIFTNGPTSLYPLDFMASFKSDDPDNDLAQQSNNWSGRNFHRWVNEEFNELYQQARTELDPERQAELFIAMNDLVVNEIVRIPLVHRNGANAVSHRLKGIQRSTFEPTGYDIENWYFEE